MGIIVFNGVSSEELGIQVEIPPDYEIPERDYEVISVPGRSGDIIIDKGAYKNVEREYKVAVGEIEGDFSVLAPRIATWLNSGYGYKRLEDSYNPDVYMMAVNKSTDSILNIYQKAGRTTIKFNRKPERFLKIGDHAIECTKRTNIINPTAYIAKPIVTIYGSGKGYVNIGDYQIEVTNIKEYITIDSDIENAYKDNQNENYNVILTDGFPKLKEGETTIRFHGGVTKVVITPRWWTI